jgi:ribonuclease E
MPNTARGGGISRKINNPSDRKKLKSHLAALDISEGMAVILRTAALERSKAELRRDCDYLVRVWDQTRELTLKSIAPTLVYEEANLIKRSIRDLYTKDLDEVVVDGEDGYKTAKDFMRMLMPSHAKKVQPYKVAAIPLFHRYQVEGQLDAMHSSNVELKSGGSIVISPTEALVAIDVNSGRSTRERDIEETAYKTNLEAAEEIARQLRLRDLAGLIVIDFIDMTDRRNQGTVERRLKEAMRSDRARIQIGRISGFGLLELSRQRLRPSLIEASTQACPHCGGNGVVRSTGSAALHALRVIEEEGIRERTSELRLTVPTVVALYILNQKRAMVAEIEQRYDFRVLVEGDDKMVPPAFTLEHMSGKPEGEAGEAVGVSASDAIVQESPKATEEKPARRRRGRRPRKTDAGEAEATPAETVVEAGAEEGSDTAGEHTDDETGVKKPRPRRRGKRGGRRRNRKKPEGETAEAMQAADDGSETAPVAVESDAAPLAEPADAATAATDGDGNSDKEAAEKPKTRTRRTAKAKPGGRVRTRRKSSKSTEKEPDAAVEPPAQQEVEAEPATTTASSAKGNGNGRDSNGDGSSADKSPTVEEVEPAITDDGPKRRGWWNRFSN